MARCKSIKSNTKRVCSADFDKRIIIQTSAITGSNTPGAEASTSFANVVTVWAKIKTTPNFSYIDGVRTAEGINTDFYIRYNSSIDLTKQLWIEYDSKRYKVINSDDIDKDKQTIRLRTNELGDKTLAANKR